MNVQQAYNVWADQYDTNSNRTRDMEGTVLKILMSTLLPVSNKSCLEIGCGTGKNTAWLVENFQKVDSADFSEQMLAVAKEKIQTHNVTFYQADITLPWSFSNESCDIITFSLVLEHIENIDFVFEQAVARLLPGGVIYIGELHPFKQYAGTKARFESETGTQELTCFVHHLSDFTQAGARHGLRVLHLSEHFDEGDRTTIPRVLGLLLQKE